MSIYHQKKNEKDKPLNMCHIKLENLFRYLHCLTATCYNSLNRIHKQNKNPPDKVS